MRRLAVDTAAEHAWHDCATPAIVPNIRPRPWACPVCGQHWIWRRPARPAAQWIRATPEDN